MIELAADIEAARYQLAIRGCRESRSAASFEHLEALTTSHLTPD
jgi:hypothetical protein